MARREDARRRIERTNERTVERASERRRDGEAAAPGRKKEEICDVLEDVLEYVRVRESVGDALQYWKKKKKEEKEKKGLFISRAEDLILRHATVLRGPRKTIA